jgi:Flp pilus assembly protein TadD
MQPYSIARTNLVPHQDWITVGKVRYRADIERGEVNAEGPEGKQTHRVEQVLGGKNVFYFLTPFRGGRLQVLPVAYDLRRKEWFDTAASAVRHFENLPDEPIHWTEPAYTFNTACFSCHVSQLTNNYDFKADAYTTTWVEPGINCETCHGAAAEHVRAARALNGKSMNDPRLISFKKFSAEQINSACGTCHAKMHPLTAGFVPGDKFYDHYGLTVLDHVDFYPDGRDLGENFTYTTWRLSPCVKASELNCVTCHTSSGRYRFAGGKANEACSSCHEAKARNAEAHSHHKPGKGAPGCVSCHMPMTEFARMLRSDHSMRPPMPSATIAFGSPNACNLCHTNKTPQWADSKVRKWHKDDYQAETLRIGGWIAAARRGDWSKLQEITGYLMGPKRGEVWSASLIQLLRNCPDESKWEGIKACLKDPSPLVRGAAVEALGDNLQPQWLPLLTPMLRDEYRLVRLRAAASLAGVPAEALSAEDHKARDLATDELLSSFKARPDDTAAYHNLGNLRMEQRDFGKAITAFEDALKLQPQNVSSLVNAALAYNMGGDNTLAEARLRAAAHLEPTNAAVQLNLGMLLGEVGEMEGAEQAFRAAFKFDTNSAQAAFNLGILLAESAPKESLEWCEKAAGLRPGEARYAFTLAFYQQKAGQTGNAMETLERSLKLSPAHPESYVLLVQLYDAQGRVADALRICEAGSANEKLPVELRSRFAARLQTGKGSGKVVSPPKGKL